MTPATVQGWTRGGLAVIGKRQAEQAVVRSAADIPAFANTLRPAGQAVQRQSRQAESVSPSS